MSDMENKSSRAYSEAVDCPDHHINSDQDDAVGPVSDTVSTIPTASTRERHMRPMRRRKIRRHLDDAIFEWKERAMHRFVFIQQDLSRFGYLNSATYDDIVNIIEESLKTD